MFVSCSDALCCVPLTFLVFLYGLVVCLVLLYALGLGGLGVRGWEQGV